MASGSNSKQRAAHCPLYNINPLGGGSASRCSTPTARWRRSERRPRVGFGGRADAAIRRMARLLGHSLRATRRIGTL